MSSHQWAPQRGQNSGALRSPRCTVAAHADYTAVASLGVKVFQQFPLIAFQHFPLMSMGQFDHRFWFNASQMVIKRGAMSV
jgi:hypothetical protein